VQLQFDPSIISYEHLLGEFFKGHNPNKTRLLRQYASIIFPHDEAQLSKALSAKIEFEKQQKFKCTTEIILSQISEFTDAEDYHQKYYLQMNDNIMELLDEHLGLTPAVPEFAYSPVASKLNGLCVNGVSEDNIRREIRALVGISDDLKSLLIEQLL
jgi:peptide-methionine (S)-S-oxide reductase